MRWWLLCATLPMSLLAACHGLARYGTAPAPGGEAGAADSAAAKLDGGGDGAPRGDLQAPAPTWSSYVEPFCLADWCWEHPRPHAINIRDLWVAPAGPSAAVAVGGNGFAMHFEGGQWRPRLVAGAGELRGVWGLSSSDVYAVGAHGIFHFDGTSWSPQGAEASEGRFVYAVGGTNPERIYAVGKDGLILAKRGDQWAVARTPAVSAPNLRDVWVGDEVVVAVGDEGSILAMRAGASSFGEEGGLAATVALEGVWGASPSDIWAVGGGEGGASYAVHWDGARWLDRSPSGSARLRAVWGRDGRNVYAVGDNGATWTYDGAAWSFAPIYRGPDLFAIHGDARSILAMGEQGAGYEVRAGWQALWGSGEVRQPLRAVASLGGGRAVAAGEDGRILERDGTGQWAVRDDIGASYDFYDIWGATPDHLYVVGSRYALVGEVWEYVPFVAEPGPGGVLQEASLPAGGIGRLRAIWGGSPTDILTVGTGGLAYHFDGSAWRSVDLHDANRAPISGRVDLLDVHGDPSDPSVVHAVGLRYGDPSTADAAVAFQRSSGGLIERAIEPGAETLTAVTFEAGVFYAAGARKLFTFQTSTATWQLLVDGAANRYDALCWAAGRGVVVSLVGSTEGDRKTLGSFTSNQPTLMRDEPTGCETGLGAVGGDDEHLWVVGVGGAILHRQLPW